MKCGDQVKVPGAAMGEMVEGVVHQVAGALVIVSTDQGLVGVPVGAVQALADAEPVDDQE